MTISNSSKNWSHQQLKLAFYFYCQTPFGQINSKNKKLIELAELIGRTPSARAMKCVNFASLDPAIIESGRKGLSNASQLDKVVWDEFHEDWERLSTECGLILRALQEEHQPHEDFDDGNLADGLTEFVDYTGETRTVIVEQRVKQNFFRRAVLSSYGGRCCVSGVSDPRLLVASHIVPWSRDKSNRLNPRNGLCLSALHDKAFDAHLFALTDELHIVLSNSLKHTKDDFLKEVFWKIEDKPIELPERFAPATQFLTIHREMTLSN